MFEIVKESEFTDKEFSEFLKTIKNKDDLKNQLMIFPSKSYERMSYNQKYVFMLECISHLSDKQIINILAKLAFEYSDECYWTDYKYQIEAKIKQLQKEIWGK